MILNEEWHIILRELEEEIIHQNHIKHGSHLKVNQTKKRLRNLDTIGTILRKISFYSKCSTCEMRTSKPRKTML